LEKRPTAGTELMKLDPLTIEFLRRLSMRRHPTPARNSRGAIK
jgi:hypothetical protein